MICWHYTIGAKVPPIAESGFLKGADEYVTSPEKPIVWFSSNQDYELTSRKGVKRNGEIITLSKEETAQFGGLVRFGYPSERLIKWPEVGKRAHMNAFMRNILMKEARRQGADPSEWYGSLVPIPLEGLTFQILRDNQWVDPDDE